MRVLLLHADKFEYFVTGKTSITDKLDPIPESMNAGAADEVLVCMMAVEKDDAKKSGAVAAALVTELQEHCGKVNAHRVFLYPYAHLSSTLESPRAAVKVIDTVQEQLDAVGGYEVLRAPFGVYKGFEIRVKGHPLSEIAKTISAEGKAETESAALKSDEEKKSEWLIITPDGQEHKAADFDLSAYPTLEKMSQYEFSGDRVSDEPPPHIALMQEHELVDYEPGSDKGWFRWYPKGWLIKKLLEEQVNAIMARYGAMQVETPLCYDMDHPALSKYLNKFPARQYVIQSDDRQLFLRFAACFGQYLMKHDMQISYRNLPLRLYELTHYSFRREQSGELAGLRRLRAFTMPDMHTLCGDMGQAMTEMQQQVDLSFEWIHDLGFEKKDYAVAVRAVKDFYEENKEHLKDVARKADQPVLVEIWDKRYFYFVNKFEINYVDSQGKASALSTVQIDVENAEQFDISYVGADGNSACPLVLHASISGSIDRNLYAILEQQAMQMAKGTKAALPFWLAPTQVRLIPVRPAEHGAFCEELAGKLGARVDIDDRDESIGKRIRSAEKEWVPLSLVIGEKEMAGETFSVRVRGVKEAQQMTLAELSGHIEQEMAGKVFRSINLPGSLSRRPIFRG